MSLVMVAPALHVDVAPSPDSSCTVEHSMHLLFSKACLWQIARVAFYGTEQGLTQLQSMHLAGPRPKLRMSCRTSCATCPSVLTSTGSSHSAVVYSCICDLA